MLRCVIASLALVHVLGAPAASFSYGGDLCNPQEDVIANVLVQVDAVNNRASVSIFTADGKHPLPFE